VSPRHEAKDNKRNMMKQVLPGIWQWSWFSQEKQIDFNGLFLTVGEHRVLVDPPLMNAEEMTQARRGGQIDYILITNRDHSREAAAYKKEFTCQVWVSEVDASQMDIQADKTYKDGELLSGGIWAVHLKDQKSPGECALFLQQIPGQGASRRDRDGRVESGIMIVGDALIGKPPGSLSLLPAEKYADLGKAREGLRRLLKYNFDTLLVGDGASIMTGAKQVVEKVLTNKP
jgi:hypothetical protein